ncbi:MAG TPA: hypothetical protein VFL78_07670 [Rhodanobacteraceae bacterium]|nr:hypothetical protein [Rhodanobacteraceae bacterium]
MPSDYVVPTVPAPQGTPSLTAQSVADGVHLGWTIPLAQTGIWWIIERGTSATGPWTQRAKLQGTSYTDPETSGSTYYYRVHAQNWFDGAGPYSNVVSSQGVSVDKLGDDVAAAAAAAQAAQDAADTANDALADIASDNVLSSPEKPVVMRDYSVITTE